MVVSITHPVSAFWWCPKPWKRDGIKRCRAAVSLVRVCMIQSDELLLTTIAIDSFARFPKHMVNNFCVGATNAKHFLLSEAICPWSRCWCFEKATFFFAFGILKMLPFLIVISNSMENTLFSYRKSETLEVTLRSSSCLSVKLCAIHFPSFEIVPLACKCFEIT